MNSATMFVFLVVLTIIVLVGLVESIKAIRSRGIVDYLTYSNATPHLDDLQPGNSSTTKHFKGIAELKNHLEQNNIGFKGGKVQIWGDHKKRGLSFFNAIDSVECFLENDSLSILFTNKNQLTLYSPEHIFIARTFIKVKNADKVLWQWHGADNAEQHYIAYNRVGDSVQTDTNTAWKPGKYDLILQKPAVFIC